MKTNITLENQHVFIQTYILKWFFFHCHVSLPVTGDVTFFFVAKKRAGWFHRKQLLRC